MGARRWRWIAVFAVAVAVVATGSWRLAPRPEPAGLPLVAVLPFALLTDDAATRRLAGGLTADMITDLARFDEFAVLSAGATEDLASRPADMTAVRDALGAGFVVDGSIDRQAERVRITARLFDTGSGRSLWADRWDRPAADLFAVQSEIAETIANRLGGGAGIVQEAGRIAAHRKAPASLDAYDLYLLGSERLEKLTRRDVEAALGLLERAVALDPGLARAWVEISHGRRYLAVDQEIDPVTNWQAAVWAAERAVQLDPSDAEAHAAMGFIFGDENDFVRAKAAFDRALTLAPSSTDILTQYVGWASTFGEPERGAAMVDRVIRLEPDFPTWKALFFTYAYFMAGRYEEALGMADRLPPEMHTPMVWAI